MYSFKKYFIASSFIVLAFAACKKKDTVAPTPSAVAITAISPSGGQIVHKGDSVHIGANVTYITELHGYDMTITDAATGDVLFAAGEDIHDDHFAVQQVWYDTVSQAKDLNLTLSVHIDHDGNMVDTTVAFKSQP